MPTANLLIVDRTATPRFLRVLWTFLSVLCLLGSSLTAVGQVLSVAKPESVGLSSQRLERIATAVQRDVDQKRIAGAVTLVARRGHVVWLKAQGMMDREAKRVSRCRLIPSFASAQ